LKLDDPTDFTGQISNLSGTDGIDLAGFDSNTTHIAPNSTTASTVLTVTDATHAVQNNTAVNITLLGDYTNSTFTFSNDTDGGVLIVDPPAPGSQVPIVASVPNRTLIGQGSSDNFVFNFAGIGKDTVTNFHPATDTLQFSSPIFASAQAAMDATQDDGHGNAVIALDPNDTITLTGVLKAQLHVTDFHVV
jgi:hypothetical protein